MWNPFPEIGELFSRCEQDCALRRVALRNGVLLNQLMWSLLPRNQFALTACGRLNSNCKWTNLYGFTCTADWKEEGVGQFERTSERSRPGFQRINVRPPRARRGVCGTLLGIGAGASRRVYRLVRYTVQSDTPTGLK